MVVLLYGNAKGISLSRIRCFAEFRGQVLQDKIRLLTKSSPQIEANILRILRFSAEKILRILCFSAKKILRKEKKHYFCAVKKASYGTRKTLQAKDI